MGIFGDILNQVDGAKDRVLDTVLEGTGDQGGLFRGGVDDVLLDTLNIGGNVLQGVADVGKPLIGQARYGQMALRNELGLVDEEDWLAVKEARERGGDDFLRQGRSVWENEIVDDMPWWQRAIADTAIDPTVWAGVGVPMTIGRGLTALGKADDASRLMRGVSKLGAPIEKAGVALNAPDKYIFDPAINALAVKPVKGAAALLDAGARKVAPVKTRTIDQALEELHAKARRQMAKWTSLAPKEKFRENAEWVSGGVSRLLNGGDLETSPVAREGSRNAYLTTMQPDVIAERKARQLRNEIYRSQAARDTLAGYPGVQARDVPVGTTLFSGSGQAAPSRGQTDIMLETKDVFRQLRERAQRHGVGVGQPGTALGIVPGATSATPDEIANRTFGTPVETTFGTLIRYATREERETISRAAAKMILEEAHTRGTMRSYRFALEDLQQIKEQFIEQNPGARALWPDIYNRAKQIVESEGGERLPSVMYAGSGPTGGGLDLATATDKEKKQFVENTASGIVQAMRKGGTAQEFRAGGKYHGRNSLRPVVEGDGVGEGGLQLATFEEFYPALVREFGQISEDEAREIFTMGVERFRRNMVQAVKRKAVPLTVPGQERRDVEFAGMAANADEFMGVVERGRDGLGFYGDAVADLRSEFESEGDYRAFMQILSATSSNTAVEDNVSRAIDAWVQWKVNNREALKAIGMDDEFIDSLGYTNFAQQQLYPAHREAIFKAQRGEFIDTQKLTSYEGSFKTEELYEQIREAFKYNPDIPMSREDQEQMAAEVLDSFVRSSGFSTGDIWNQRVHHMPDQPNVDQYQAQEAFARYLANETGIPPQQLQEMAWAGGKFDVGYQPAEEGTAADFGAMRNVVNRIRNSGAKSFDEYVQKRAVPMVERWMDDATDSIRATLIEAEKYGQSVWSPNLRGDPVSKTSPKSSLNTKVTKETGKRDIAFEKPGVHIVSHRISIPEGATVSPDEVDARVVRDLMKFKLRMDEAFEPAWLNTRVIMDIDQPDGSINLDVFYYPEGAGVDRLQAAIDRVNATSTGTDDQFANAKRILPKVARIDRRARSVSKNSGRNLKNAVSGIDSYAAKFDEDPAFEGMSFKITEDGALQEWPETPRYVVSLTSAGERGTLPKGQKQAARRKAIQQFIEQMEPVWNGVDEDRVTFGLFGMPDGQSYSLDLNFVTDDLEQAQRVAAATNQVSIWDNEGMAEIPAAGGARDSNSPLKTAEQVNQFLDELVVGQPGTPSGSSLGAIPQGVDPIAGANAVASEFLNTRLGREVAGRLGLGYNEVAEGTVRQSDEYLTMVKQNLAELNDAMDPPDGVFWLSEDENRRLFHTTFEDGESIGSYAMRMRDELQAEQDALADAGIFWKETESKGEATARAQDDELKKIVAKWHDNGINPNDDINRAVDQIIQKRLAKESGLPVDQRGVYDKMKAIWAEQVLASGRYVMANLTTNVLDALITGHFNLGSGADVYRLASADIKRIDPEDIIKSTKAYEVLSKYGLGDSLSEISTAQGTRAMAGTVRRGSQTRALLDTVKLGSLAKVVELPMAMAQGIDTNSRLAMFTDVLERVFHERRPELLAKVDSVAMDAGIDITGVDMLPSYDPSYLYGHYKALGMGDGHAERASRHVAELRNEARKEAIKEINRVFLSYRKTNLDEALGKVIPFHYWASRKLRFYAEEAYRNPWLISAYWRSLQGIERAQEDPGLNARQKGFLRLMSGPAGFSLLMNPDALLGVIKASQLDTGWPAENESGMGGIIRVLKQQGVGFYPWIDGAMNLMGVYGDTFEPDMLGIRHRALVGGVVNWMRGEGLLGESNRDMGAAPYTDAMLSAREEVSSWVSSFTPDWLSQPVQKKAGGSIGNATMDDIIEVRIIEENPSLTNLELARIMNDPDSPEYQSAFQDVARAGVLKQLLNFSMPVSFRVDSDKRDVESAQRTEISKEADRLGVMPWEVNNGNASLEFKAQYEKQTGKRFDVKDWETTSLEREVRRADPQARRFVVLENEYQSIIPDAIKPYVDTFWAIKQGRMSPPGYQGSLAGQPQQVLDWYADRYLESVGQRDNVYTHINLQQQFRETNPDFAQFKDWQGQMFTLQAAYGGSLDEYRRVISNQNPAAAAFFNRELQHIQDRGIPPEQWGPELDQVTTSSSAWFAIHGQPMMQTDFARTSDVGTGDVMPEMMAPLQGNMNSQPTPPSEDWVSVYNSRR